MWPDYKPNFAAMQKSIVYGRIWKIALVTSPLLGIFGSNPLFVFEHDEWSQIGFIFFSVTATVFIFWLINIGLLRLWEQKGITRLFGLRYILSIVLCSMVFVTIAEFRKPLRPSKFDHPQAMKHIPAADGENRLPPDFKPPRHFILVPLLQSQSLNIFILILLEFFLLRRKKELADEEIVALKMANMEARLTALRQQLHPHFLFNALSTLKSLIKRSPVDAENYLDKLATLLRSSTTSGNGAVIPLQDELALVEGYVQMQQVRFYAALQVKIDVPQILRDAYSVPVYALQLLVENAVKHNKLTASHPLIIHIKGDEQTASVSVENNIQLLSRQGERGGMGLSNLAERYRLLNAEGIRITESTGSFQVTIKLLKK